MSAAAWQVDGLQSANAFRIIEMERKKETFSGLLIAMSGAFGKFLIWKMERPLFNANKI